MAQLAIDVNETVWRLVREYVDARRADVMDSLLSMTASDQERRDAAVRMDELALLLAAPGDTLRASEATHSAAQSSRPIY